MTRVTLSEVKKAARDPIARRARGPSDPLPTPFPTALSAIRRFHRDGADSARDYITRTYAASGYWGSSGRPQARSWADAMRGSFETYVMLASADPRTVLDGGISCDVPLGHHEIGVSLDVVLIDPNGYTGRLLLWDVPIPTAEEAAFLAAPVAAATEQELGAGRTSSVEVWHLRSGTTRTISRAAALAKLLNVESVVNRYVS